MGFFYFYKSCFRSTFSAFDVNLGVKNGVIFRAYIPQKTFCNESARGHNPCAFRFIFYFLAFSGRIPTSKRYILLRSILLS